MDKNKQPVFFSFDGIGYTWHAITSTEILPTVEIKIWIDNHIPCTRTLINMFSDIACLKWIQINNICRPKRRFVSIRYDVCGEIGQCTIF